MAWPDSADPAIVKAYRHAYYLAHKEQENKDRARRYREARARRRAYREKHGPMIPEWRLYEVPPNIRQLVYAKLIKENGSRPKPRSTGTRREETPEAEKVLLDNGEGS